MKGPIVFLCVVVVCLLVLAVVQHRELDAIEDSIRLLNQKTDEYGAIAAKVSQRLRVADSNLNNVEIKTTDHYRQVAAEDLADTVEFEVGTAREIPRSEMIEREAQSLRKKAIERALIKWLGWFVGTDRFTDYSEITTPSGIE